MLKNFKKWYFTLPLIVYKIIGFILLFTILSIFLALFISISYLEIIALIQLDILPATHTLMFTIILMLINTLIIWFIFLSLIGFFKYVKANKDYIQSKIYK